jgi:Leucine-rich repeat (LRR) protein
MKAQGRAYREAEQKIESASRRGAFDLDLSVAVSDWQKLTELPESICQLTQLQSINLSGNELATLPEGLSQLRQLQILNVSGNRLTHLPDRITKLSKLKSLNASGNWLAQLPTTFGNLTALEVLMLAENRLAALPESFAHLVKLQTLDISKNQLTSLPEKLGPLIQLRMLNISHNKLSTLPQYLGPLTTLTSLDVSHNDLADLPTSLGPFAQLQEAHLSHNRLVTLPATFGPLTAISSLDISHNRLCNVPNAIADSGQLRSLDLCHNRLTELPERIERLAQLSSLELSDNQLTEVPDSVGSLTQLKSLNLAHNQLTELPESVAKLKHLETLRLEGNRFNTFPVAITRLTSLQELDTSDNRILCIPESAGDLLSLRALILGKGKEGNRLSDLPFSLARLSNLVTLRLDANPLNPELAAAYKEGLTSIKRYLRAKAVGQVFLNEAKLILVGEGEVGKSCLLGALRGDGWIDDRDTTHGIEIRPLRVKDPITELEFVLNGWDFGGQPVYRPTHQLFFSAPAVYLVVWKPREGPQQGHVKEWIKLIKHREPDAKILVVATHGGPGDRQPDIDRQDLWDQFGKDMLINFFHVDSRPPLLDKKTGKRSGDCLGIRELRSAIASTAASLPEMGRTFPKAWQKAREALRKSESPYLSLDRVLSICQRHGVEDLDAKVLLRICHRIGDLIYYEHDPALRNIVVLRPSWLATAISFILDDKETRDVRRGMVSFDRLARLWNDLDKPPEARYSPNLHPLFVRLMERFDLSYKVAIPGEPDDALAFWQNMQSLVSGEEFTEKIRYTSLVAQLVPDIRPDPVLGWPANPSSGDQQQVQVCRVVERASNLSANAEGLFFQLIVRLHKYSLGRENVGDSVHWKRGLLVEDDTGARGFLEHVGNDIRITVRSPYPQRFLAALTYEVQWLVTAFWGGLRCEVTVPCLATEIGGKTCNGLFEVSKLLESKKRNHPEQPCPRCNTWQSIDSVLLNAPAARPNPIAELLANFVLMTRRLTSMRRELASQHAGIIGRFDRLEANNKELISKVEAAYSGVMNTLLDEAKEGPRLFSFEPVDPGFFDRPSWMNAQFKLMLWCEHSRLPIWHLAKDQHIGVYTINLPREWLLKAAPFLRVLASTLGLILPVVAAGTKVVLPEADYTAIEAQLSLGKSTAESLLAGGSEIGDWIVTDDQLQIDPSGKAVRAEGAILRQLHVWLREHDPTFGGLVRVQNKRQEFLWVHPMFESSY